MHDLVFSKLNLGLHSSIISKQCLDPLTRVFIEEEIIEFINKDEMIYNMSE